MLKAFGGPFVLFGPLFTSHLLLYIKVAPPALCCSHCLIVLLLTSDCWLNVSLCEGFTLTPYCISSGYKGTWHWVGPRAISVEWNGRMGLLASGHFSLGISLTQTRSDLISVCFRDTQKPLSHTGRMVLPQLSCKGFGHFKLSVSGRPFLSIQVLHASEQWFLFCSANILWHLLCEWTMIVGTLLFSFFSSVLMRACVRACVRRLVYIPVFMHMPEEESVPCCYPLPCSLETVFHWIWC